MNAIFRALTHNIFNFMTTQLHLTAQQIRDLDIKEVFSGQSMSQHRQDVFVLSELGFKQNGYFVEFGATNGKDISNSWVLERVFGWTGILAEPGKNWHEDLFKNRKCHIETKCVWKETGPILTFNETLVPDLSCINEFSAHDMWAHSRENGKLYEVETISLNDMLAKYNAPNEIDYLSIDTEGSEFDILNTFDFDRYKIKVITCEHNFTPMRNTIFQLLTSKGYIRKYTEISNVDDWYVLPPQ